MANDATLPVRRALLTAMKADAGLTAIVASASIYPQATMAVPPYPFIRYGSPTVLPRRAACLDGAEITVDIHGFSNGRKDGDQVVETPEDHASRIGAAIAASLDRKRVALPTGYARIRWTGSRLLQDPEEASVFHTVQSLLVHVIA